LEVQKHFLRQFRYDAWANAEVLAAIKAAMAGSPQAQALHLLAHILSAQRLWLERLREQPQSLPVWPEFDLEQCAAQIAELVTLWREYIAALSGTGLSETIAYKNSKGEAWTSTVEDVLTHVILHSAYHRGQIGSLMRAEGAVPAYTDFIHAVRQGFAE
jgi:uncharacterized damage-inducible protein DinB